MLRPVLIVSFAISSLLAGAARTRAETGKYPQHCRADEIPKQNSEFVWDENQMVVIAPVPGRDEVGPSKMEWCTKIAPIQDECPARKSDVAAKVTRAFQGGHWDSDEWLLRNLCQFPDDRGFQEQAGYVIQQWVNLNGQTKDEAIESLVRRADDEKWKQGVEAGCSKLPRPDEEASPEEVEMAAAERVVVGCRAGVSTSDVGWYVDRTDQPPSELARLFDIRTCFLSGLSGPLDPANKDEWLKIGFCGADVRALDRAKLEKETAGMTTPLQTVALEAYSNARATLADLEQAAKAKVASDPEYKKLLYEVPGAAWDGWVKDYQRHKAAVDSTLKFEKDLFGPRKSGYENCWRDVEPGFAKFVKAGKFKTKEEFTEGVTGPIGFVLLDALGACYAVTAPSSVGALLLDLAGTAPAWRGPRAAVRVAMSRALGDIKADRVRFPVEYRQFGHKQPNLIRQAALGSDKSRIPRSGSMYKQVTNGLVVKGLAPLKGNDEQIVLTFQSESWAEDVRDCRDTKRIWKIEDDGRVVYYRECRKPVRKRVTATPSPARLYKWSAEGIKPNALVILMSEPTLGHGDHQRGGYPLEVYTDKTKKKLVNMYGFPL